MSATISGGGPDGTRRPGRPRTEGHDDLILGAVIELIDAGEKVTLRAVVESSGVSRAALYRRWPSLTDLVAAALDRGRSIPPFAPSYSDPEQFVEDLLAEARSVGSAGVAGASRFRTRLLMGLQDPQLQKVYWEQHASRRREPMRSAIEAGKADGTFRADLDTEACCDLLASVFYYQVVARGEAGLEGSGQRVENALRVVVDGMRA